jgi:hypothetical protein
MSLEPETRMVAGERRWQPEGKGFVRNECKTMFKENRSAVENRERRSSYMEGTKKLGKNQTI